jgi:hypothetical protein
MQREIIAKQQNDGCLVFSASADASLASPGEYLTALSILLTAALNR